MKYVASGNCRHCDAARGHEINRYQYDIRYFSSIQQESQIYDAGITARNLSIKDCASVGTSLSSVCSLCLLRLLECQSCIATRLLTGGSQIDVFSWVSRPVVPHVSYWCIAQWGINIRTLHVWMFKVHGCDQFWNTLKRSGLVFSAIWGFSPVGLPLVFQVLRPLGQ